MATRGGRGSNWERQSAPRASRAGLSKVLDQASAFSIIFPACIYYLFGNVFSPKLFLWAGSVGCYLGQPDNSVCTSPHASLPVFGPGVTGPEDGPLHVLGHDPCSVTVIRGWLAHKVRLAQSTGLAVTHPVPLFTSGLPGFQGLPENSMKVPDPLLRKRD